MVQASATKSSVNAHLQKTEHTYNRDTMPADASVVLEDNVAALVDRKTVILVVDNAKRTEMRS